MEQLQITVTTSLVPREYQTEMKKNSNLGVLKIFVGVKYFFKGSPRNDLFYEKYIWFMHFTHEF